MDRIQSTAYNNIALVFIKFECSGFDYKYDKDEHRHNIFNRTYLHKYYFVGVLKKRKAVNET